MTGLIGWWPLHENSGSTARDLSGRGNHGTLNGGVTQGVAGKGGLTGYSLNGSGNYIDIPSFSQFSEYAVSFWFRPDDSKTSGSGFVAQIQNNNNTQIYTAGDGTITLWHDGTNTSGSYVDKAWNHFIGMWDGNSTYLYIDAVATDSSSVSTTSSAGNIDNIGSYNGSSDYWAGEICDFRVYNRALSPQEIQTLYEWGSGDYTDRSYHDGSDPGAVSRWKFNDESDTSNAVDSWSSNDGSIQGPVYSAGFRGKSLDFDSSNSEKVNFSLGQQLSDLTVSAWIKPVNYAESGSHDIVGFQDTGGGERSIRLSDGNLLIKGGNSAGGSASYSVSDYTGWNFVAYTFNDSTSKRKLWVNGFQVVSDTDSENKIKSSGHEIGSLPNYGNYFNGKIDDVRIYNRALQPHEVFQLYQWGTRGRDMRKLTVNSRGDQ